MGYAGGKEDHPTYRRIGDHTETVQVDFDPGIISFEQLLDIFWESHRPYRQSFSWQYRNVVFFHDDGQRLAAETSKTAIEQKTGKPVKTDIAPLGTFTLAEDYNQKYLLKHHPLKQEITRIYPRHEDLVNSTAAARLNGYAGKNGTPEQLSREINTLGLTEYGRTLVKKLVQ